MTKLVCPECGSGDIATVHGELKGCTNCCCVDHISAFEVEEESETLPADFMRTYSF